MSYVTGILLSFSAGHDESDILGQVNAFFSQENSVSTPGPDVRLRPIEEGGNKYIESSVAAGAFNYLDIEGLLVHLRDRVRWNDYGWAQVLVQGQHDEGWALVEVYRARTEDRPDNSQYEALLTTRQAASESSE